MKIITRKILTEEAKNNFYNLRSFSDPNYEIYTRLLRTSDPDEVEEITGNRGFTMLSCDECKKDKNMGIRFEMAEHGIRHICVDCILNAVKLLFGG